MSHRRWGGAETNDSCHAYDRGLTELAVKGWQIVQGPALALAQEPGPRVQCMWPMRWMPPPTTRMAGTAQRISTGIFLSSNELLPAKNGKKWQTFPREPERAG